jgi:uncharacterized membrane protein YhaH (DUF805 family)
MDTEQLEKQFQMWNRFLYMVLGSSITLAVISFGTISYGTEWPGFGNYTGGVWTSLQFLATLPGLYLLWGRRWKPIPLSSRRNTIFGYFVASWITLLSFGFIIESGPATDYYFLLVGSAILIALGYIWARRRTATPRDEIFP